MLTVQSAGETRTLERLRMHYLVERQLAERLRRADRAERQKLYCTVYDELFRQVTDHPQLTRKADPGAQEEAVAHHIRLIEPFLRPDSVYMEIGPGDCSFAIAVARRTRQVFAVDVSAEITRQKTLPANMDVIICKGADIPVPAGQVNIAFSYQLVEHLHPVDAREHAAKMFQALAPGGVYVCVTPNRLNGPHDVSKYFDTQASGFHMKEYTTGELTELFRSAGFSRVRVLIGAWGHFFQLPSLPVRLLEAALLPLPAGLRTRVARAPIVRHLLGVTTVATK